jgi:alpha-beta hydrolase superfamily lysophospholipase
VTPPSLRRSESHLEGSGDIRLFRRSWLAPDPPERVLVVIHGLAEHSGRYQDLGSWFAQRGSAVHAYDQRGHGRSGGEPGHVERFEHLLDDLERVLASVREEHPGTPVFLVGHSMGGLVLTAFLRERRPDVAGAVSSGAALTVGDKIRPLQAGLLRLTRRLRPRQRMDTGIDVATLSRDPEVGRRYQEDPLVFSEVSLSLVAELHAASERTAGGGADVQVPMLVLHGEDDALCAPRGSQELHAGLGAPGSELRLYPDLRHEIFNEPEAEAIFGDVLDWLRKHTA